jgi:hypothetical protein
MTLESNLIYYTIVSQKQPIVFIEEQEIIVLMSNGDISFFPFHTMLNTRRLICQRKLLQIPAGKGRYFSMRARQ